MGVELGLSLGKRRKKSRVGGGQGPGTLAHTKGTRHGSRRNQMRSR